MAILTSLTYDVKVTIDGKFPDTISSDGIEGFLNNAFATRGLSIIPGHLNSDSPNYQPDLSFLVLAQNGNHDGSSIVGALLAEAKEIDGFKFDYYDKIAVAPEYRNNGVMKAMIGIAKNVGDEKGNDSPAVLRTSDPDLDKVYGAMSDISIKVGNFYVHGFGFYNDGIPLIDDALWEFQLAAHYVAILPETIVPKTTEQ